MIEQSIRAQYQYYLADPIARILHQTIKPNQVTWLSAFLGFLVIPALLLEHSYTAVACLLLSGFCDTLDGTLARMNRQSSDWGSVLDITIDRAVEFSVVLALFLVAPQARAIWCLLMLGSMLLCITSFLVVGIFSSNQSEKSFHYSPGLMERAEAFFFFILMMLWPELFAGLALLFTVLVCLTAVIRLFQFYRQQQI